MFKNANAQKKKTKNKKTLVTKSARRDAEIMTGVVLVEWKNDSWDMRA